MNKKVFTLLFIAGLLGASVESSDLQETNPLMMNQKRFEEDILRGVTLDEFRKKSNQSATSGEAEPIWLIYFYAPWADSNKRLQPVWDALANRLLVDDKYLAKKLNVRVAQVDCQESKKLCDFLDVSNLPSLRVIEGTKAYEYATGEASPQSIISFLQNQAYRAVSSSNVYDFVKGKIQQIKETAKEQSSQMEEGAWTLWDRLRIIIFNFLSLSPEGYLAWMSEKLFRFMGFGELNLGMKMIGFFMIVIMPMIILLYMILLPQGGKQYGQGVPIQPFREESRVAQEQELRSSDDLKEKKDS